MIMVAKAVTTGHHCGSFQSVQKSQSPANSSLVISAAPPTIKIAVTQKTTSQVRSIYLYFALSNSRSSSRRCRSAVAAAAIDGLVAAIYILSPDPKTSARHTGRRSGVRVRGSTTCGRRIDMGRRFDADLVAFLNLVEPQNGLTPHCEHPARQPAIRHERPMERHREELLGE